MCIATQKKQRDKSQECADGDFSFLYSGRGGKHRYYYDTAPYGVVTRFSFIHTDRYAPTEVQIRPASPSYILVIEADTCIHRT